MMGANRAAVLQQMPADSIEKIEVITNPSAKYKPDGTAGIINISLKKKQDPGYSGSVRANVGNDRRYNAGVSASYNPGKYTFSGNVNLRQDDRIRTLQDTRSHLDAATNRVVSTEQFTTEHTRPLSKIGQLGFDYKIDDENKLGTSARYNHRRHTRVGDERDTSRDFNGTILTDYDRLRAGWEVEQDLEFSAQYHHAFAAEDRELNLELKRSKSTEDQDNEYSNVYRTALPTTFDQVLVNNAERNTEFIAEYSHPLEAGAKIEAGYNVEIANNDFDYAGANRNAITGAWIPNAQVTNHFVYDQTVHAAYATYARPVGAFGFLAGLRLEETRIATHQVTAAIRDHQDYFRAYPSLHLSYNLKDHHQLQANYSHRIHRPESESLNPYPNYSDPFNLRAGNPRLLPEETHSIEAGYQFKDGDTSYLGTLYYRYSYHGITDVSRYINSTTLLTTKENLAKSQSGGLELAATRTLGKASFNFSSNAFYNEIDASNLGYSAKKSAVTWSAKLNTNFRATKADLIQLNANYYAKRLTPQGYRLPTYVANLGYRHDLPNKKTALIITLSDVFHTLKEESRVNTAILQDDRIGRRTSRIVFVGIIYNFGKPTKKSKDEIPFDSSP